MSPTLVQNKSGTATSGTSITVTLTSNTTAGNCLIVKVGAFQGTTTPTVSGITLGGSAGNFAKAKSGAGTTVDCEIWTDQNCAGGQTSVVVTFNAGTGTLLTMAVQVEEWSGLATSGAVDVDNSGANSSSTSWSSGSSGTLTNANELVVGAVYSSNPSSTLTTPGSPWTELTQVTVTNTITSKLGTAYQVVTANTAQTYSGTQSTASANAAVVVTLKEAAGGGGGGPTGLLLVL